MNDIRTLIRSSAISLIIVILGLFILCVSRAPRINVDEPMIESDQSGENLSDEEFLKLLESEESAEEKESSTSKSILLGDGSDSAESGDEDLSDIFAMLNAEDDQQTGSEDDELEKLLAESEGGVEETKPTPSVANTANQESYSNLQNQAQKLEQVVEEKDSEIAMLNQSISDYDRQIADLETEGNYPGGGVNGGTDYRASGTGEMSSSEASDDSSPFQEKYETALNAFNNRQYQAAVSAFNKLLQQSPNHELADNCQYWIGESQYARGNYYQAIVEFEKVFSYDAADKRDDAQIMIGLSYIKIGMTEQAKGDLSWFLACYQQSEYYNKAQFYYNQF